MFLHLICIVSRRRLNIEFKFSFIVYFFSFSFVIQHCFHLLPLRFHCVGVCLDRTQDCCDFDIETLGQISYTTRLDSSNLSQISSTLGQISSAVGQISSTLGQISILFYLCLECIFKFSRIYIASTPVCTLYNVHIYMCRKSQLLQLDTEKNQEGKNKSYM